MKDRAGCARLNIIEHKICRQHVRDTGTKALVYGTWINAMSRIAIIYRGASERSKCTGRTTSKVVPYPARESTDTVP